MVEVRPHWPGRLVACSPYELNVRETPPTGDPAAERAVYVHGLGGAATNWTDLMGLFADGFDQWAIDLPGFGWSPPPPDGDYTPTGHARAVSAFIESVWDGRPVHLFGNSLGGAVAVRVAATRPELVRTLTLVSPALPVLRPRRTNLHLPALATPFLGQQLLQRLSDVPVERRVRATLALCFADPGSVPAQRYESAVEEARRRGTLPYEGEVLLRSLRGLLATYLIRGAEAPWQLAARISAPTLLVYGLRDKLVDPRTSARAMRTIPDARLVTLPDSGHVAQMEHPDVVARAVRSFLAEIASRTAPPGH